MVPPITKVYSPAEIAAFKAAIDTAYAIIHPSTPSVSESDKSKLEGVQREQFEFLTSSTTIGLNQASKMPQEYNHANQVVANNLVVVYDDFQTYIQPLVAELKISYEVSADQAIKLGEMVLRVMKFQATINAAMKVMYQGLSLLYKKKSVKVPKAPKV